MPANQGPLLVRKRGAAGPTFLVGGRPFSSGVGLPPLPLPREPKGLRGYFFAVLARSSRARESMSRTMSSIGPAPSRQLSMQSETSLPRSAAGSADRAMASVLQSSRSACRSARMPARVRSMAASSAVGFGVGLPQAATRAAAASAIVRMAGV